MSCSEGKALLAASRRVSGGVDLGADARRPARAEGDRKAMGPMRGFERLHRELNLNPQQEELWKKAQDCAA